MKIGIIGLGVVGGTLYKGLKYLGHDVWGYDRNRKEEFKCALKISDLFDNDYIFLCLPTPDSPEGIDMSAFDEVMPLLVGYTGTVVIKSTVLPGTAKKFIDTYKLKIISNPEFLTEACAETDFFSSRVIAGGENAVDFVHDVYSKLQVPSRCLETNAEAEMSKYMANCFLATKVVFANQMYKICQHFGIEDYYEVLDTVLLDERIGQTHMFLNKAGGYGGMCFPKDMNAMAQFNDFIKVVDEFNKKNIKEQD